MSTNVDELIEGILSKSGSKSTTHHTTTASTVHHSAPPFDDSVIQNVLWFRLFIEILIRMNDTEEAKDDMLRFWRNEINEEASELAVLDEFDRTFEPSRAIWWFTRECPLYRIIGKASHSKNPADVYAIRFIIKYIYLQLQEEYQKCFGGMPHHRFIVYRGVGMKREDIDIMKTKIGSLYTGKGLLSASARLDNARYFIRSISNRSTMIPVLFEIETNAKQTALPYAEICKLTDYPQESEVLFMFGTIFQIDAVHYNENSKMYIIKLSLCEEDDPRLKDMVDYIKYEIKDTADLVTLADLFIKMGEYDLSKEYYNKYQEQLSVNDPNMKRVWQGLSNLADVEGNYYISLNDYKRAHQCFNEQLKLCQNLPSRHPQFGKCYANIASLCEIQGEKRLALENYEKAHEIYVQSLPAYHPDTTKVELSIENLSPRKSCNASETR